VCIESLQTCKIVPSCWLDFSLSYLSFKRNELPPVNIILHT